MENTEVRKMVDTPTPDTALPAKRAADSKDGGMIRAIFDWFTAPRRHRDGVEAAMRGLHEASKK